MIRYSLRCERGHAFESWFQSSSAYETQEKRKLVNCPVCGSAKVERAIMAPQIVSKKGRDSAVPAPAAPTPTDVTTPTSTPLLMAQERELRAKLRELRDHIVKNADNVGERFPNEARKMHYGDIEHRPAENALWRYRAPSDLRRSVTGRSARPDRRGRRSLAVAGTAGRQELTSFVIPGHASSRGPGISRFRVRSLCSRPGTTADASLPA